MAEATDSDMSAPLLVKNSAHFTSATIEEVTDSDVRSAQQSAMSSANYTSSTKLDFDNINIKVDKESAMLSTNYTSATIPWVMPTSPVELTRHPGSPRSSQQVENEVTPDWNIMIQDHGDVFLLPDCTCCRVPTILRHLKEEAYTPKLVSIGPFHHGDKRLQNMERFKQTIFQKFTQRARSSREDLVPFVQHLEPKVRASYPKTINLTDNQEFVDMILLDAVFIIELFIMSYELQEEGGNKEALLIQPWLKNSVRFDLLLLENQLPFFFIEELFNKAFSHQDLCGSLPSFLKLAYDYFGYYNIQELEPNPDVKIKHFTDLLRLFYLKGSMPKRVPTPEDGSHILSYNANALQEAGVKLRHNHKSKCLLDLTFSGHNTLEIPQIVVDDNTELLFRNMIALEQCHYPCHAYVTDYALLLDSLIDTNKDVDLLIHKKIVLNYLGDTDKVASFINGISDNVVQTTFNSDFLEICKSLKDYCKDPWHKLKATLRHNYCFGPWQTVATIASIVLLFLTVAQTVFSFLQLVN